jgi:3-oxoacyl-(acyl-carrier-protein) synthase
LTNVRVFVTGVGIISPLGRGRQATLAALQRGDRVIKPVSLFPVSHTEPLPVGEITEFIETESVPRTHVLALLAAQEAVSGAYEPPDAIILGVCSGGMPTTETLLKEKVSDPARYLYHAVGSVAAHIARAVGCQGPVLTVSTACSSGSVALAIAMEMLKGGKARSVLAGGGRCPLPDDVLWFSCAPTGRCCGRPPS